MNLKNLCSTQEKEKVSDYISSWTSGSERELNVITPPWNGADIFLKTVFTYVKDHKSILYITDERENIQVIEGIKKNSDFRGYTYLRDTSDYRYSDFVITNYKAAENLDKKFDLVIYDEINSLPEHDNEKIIKLTEKLTKYGGKRIAYSVEEIYKNRNEIVLPVRDRNVPVIEPRDIITRIDINKDIPYMVYGYLKWSINNNRNVIIYVPSENKVEKVYSYMNRYSWDKNCSISFFIKEKSDIKIMLNFYKRKNSIMITNEFGIAPARLFNTDIMVFFANDKVFNHKILTHIYSRVSRADRDSKGEAVFLYNENGSNIEAAKAIARNFNKEAWETGLLRL